MFRFLVPLLVMYTTAFASTRDIVSQTCRITAFPEAFRQLTLRPYRYEYKTLPIPAQDMDRLLQLGWEVVDGTSFFTVERDQSFTYDLNKAVSQSGSQVIIKYNYLHCYRSADLMQGELRTWRNCRGHYEMFYWNPETSTKTLIRSGITSKDFPKCVISADGRP
jgi:hypothetical protein